RMIDGRAPKVACKLSDQLEIPVAVLERGDGRQKIARVGESIGTDGPELGQAKARTVVLAHVAASGRVLECHLEAQSARDECDLAWLDVQSAQLGPQLQRTLLRNEQQLAVRVVEIAPVHRAVAGVDVHADACL